MPKPDDIFNTGDLDRLVNKAFAPPQRPSLEAGAPRSEKDWLIHNVLDFVPSQNRKEWQGWLDKNFTTIYQPYLQIGDKKAVGLYYPPNPPGWNPQPYFRPPEDVKTLTGVKEGRIEVVANQYPSTLLHEMGHANWEENLPSLMKQAYPYFQRLAQIDPEFRQIIKNKEDIFVKDPRVAKGQLLNPEGYANIIQNVESHDRPAFLEPFFGKLDYPVQGENTTLNWMSNYFKYKANTFANNLIATLKGSAK